MGLRRDSDGFSLCLVSWHACLVGDGKDKARAERVKLNKELWVGVVQKL